MESMTIPHSVYAFEQSANATVDVIGDFGNFFHIATVQIDLEVCAKAILNHST